MPSMDETIAALATPSGESAIAMIRVSGPLSRPLAVEILGQEPQPRLAVHTDLLDREGAFLDDVIVTFFQEPHSYTGEDVIEISGHGNPLISRRILEDLFARGCLPAEPGEFTKRAFLNGRIDLSQAEAVMDLIRARGDRAIDAANRQLRGALGRQVADLIDGLLGVIAHVEAYIDFPEEDLPGEDRGALQNSLRAVIDPLSSLIATSRYGELLRSGVRTVLVGETNAGKSSLLNRLLGWERAIVSASPGTTRDFIEESRLLAGHCIRFVDTAGLNSAPGEIETLGIGLALERASDADLVLLVLDSTRPFPTLPEALSRKLDPTNTVLVWNKSDISVAGPPPREMSGVRSVHVSAVTGAGIPDLEAAVVEMIEAHRKDPGPELVAINARHANDLGECKHALTSALAKLEEESPDELLAADLRAALDALGRIGGKVDNERMLDKLFEAFCIGK